MPEYYPIMLDVRARPAVVVGGERAAAEKAAGLLASGARVTAIHPHFCAQFAELEQRYSQQLRLLPRAYAPGDLDGAFVVIVALNDAALIEELWTETRARGQLLNVVDVPARCNFIMPSVLRRDQLTIAVSTEGASPGLAKRIRQRLEALFPQEYGRYLRLASQARAELRRRGVSYEERDAFFAEFDASDILELLVAGDEEEARARITELLRRYGVEAALTGGGHD